MTRDLRSGEESATKSGLPGGSYSVVPASAYSRDIR